MNTESNSKTQADEAYELFEEEAKQKGTNYYGDIVKENLRGLVALGYSPQEAVDKLYAQAHQHHRRR